MPDSTILIVKGAVAILALLLLLLFREFATPRARRVRDLSFALLGVLSLLGFNGFRHYVQSREIHSTDFFHYYLGAKYLPELGYTRLYACSVLALREHGGTGRPSEPKLLRRLDDNLLIDTDAALASADCHAHFTPERWAMFTEDVSWFSSQLGDGVWLMLLHDHGFNGTPSWAALARVLIPARPITQTLAERLAMADLVLLALACAALVIAFRSTMASSLAALVFGCAWTWDGGWIAGSFLRLDWLAALLIGVACLRARRPFFAGAALGWATLSRLFPLFAIAGVFAAALLQKGRDGSWPRGFVPRFCAGLALAALVGLGAPLLSLGRAAVPLFAEFSENLVKHANTNLTNNIGLRQLAFAEARLDTAPDSLEQRDLFWRHEQDGGFARRFWLYLPLLAGGLLLAARALRREEPWVAAIVGIALAPWFHDLTCYYLLYQLLFGYLWLRRPEIGPVLLAAAALDAMVSLQLPVGWGDVWAIFESAIYLATCAFAMWCLGMPTRAHPASLTVAPLA